MSESLKNIQIIRLWYYLIYVILIKVHFVKINVSVKHLTCGVLSHCKRISLRLIYRLSVNLQLLFLLFHLLFCFHNYLLNALVLDFLFLLFVFLFNLSINLLYLHHLLKNKIFVFWVLVTSFFLLNFLRST